MTPWATAPSVAVSCRMKRSSCSRDLHSICHSSKGSRGDGCDEGAVFSRTCNSPILRIAAAAVLRSVSLGCDKLGLGGNNPTAPTPIAAGVDDQLYGGRRQRRQRRRFAAWLPAAGRLPEWHGLRACYDAAAARPGLHGQPARTSGFPRRSSAATSRRSASSTAARSSATSSTRKRRSSRHNADGRHRLRRPERSQHHHGRARRRRRRQRSERLHRRAGARVRRRLLDAAAASRRRAPAIRSASSLNVPNPAGHAVSRRRVAGAAAGRAARRRRHDDDRRESARGREHGDRRSDVRRAELSARPPIRPTACIRTTPATRSSPPKSCARSRSATYPAPQASCSSMTIVP